MKKVAIAAALAVGLTGQAHAAGDAAAGKDKAATCIACHGVDGNSIAPTFPNLAGQSASYMYKQLQEFKAGKRTDPTMSAMVLPLDDQAMQDVSAYYASQALKPGQPGPMSDAGKAIYRGGIRSINVPACMACHGPAGAGIPSAGYPQLASQKVTYIEKQLKDFRTAAQNPQQDITPVGRGNDASAMMRIVVKRMSDPEIQAVAQYIAGLKP